MKIVALFSGFTSKIAAGLKRLAQVVGLAETADIAHTVSASLMPAPVFHVPPVRNRKAGPVRPAGSKLARKAAEGTVGKAVLR